MGASLTRSGERDFDDRPPEAEPVVAQLTLEADKSTTPQGGERGPRVDDAPHFPSVASPLALSVRADGVVFSRYTHEPVDGGAPFHQSFEPQQ